MDGCTVLASLAGILMLAFVVLGAWMFNPIMWSWWSPEPAQQRVVRARLERIGLFRWLVLPALALALVAAGAAAGC
jgi:hypothetical protein